MPAVHDSSEFTFELHFSEEIEISYVNVRDSVLDVTGGVVKGARRLQAGSNLGWKITIEPDSTNAEVSIVLPPTTDCEAAGAVCTEDGRPLANELTAIVPGLLTARFEDMPAMHDGSQFQFELHFSEEIKISRALAVSDTVLEVTGGTATRARRLQPPSQPRLEDHHRTRHHQRSGIHRPAADNRLRRSRRSMHRRRTAPVERTDGDCARPGGQAGSRTPDLWFGRQLSQPV